MLESYLSAVVKEHFVDCAEITVIRLRTRGHIPEGGVGEVEMLEYIACGIAAVLALPYAALPLPTKGFIESRIPPLEQLGFTLRAVATCPAAGANVKNYVAILTEEASQILASSCDSRGG